jgi:hypothetical protein
MTTCTKSRFSSIYIVMNMQIGDEIVLDPDGLSFESYCRKIFIKAIIKIMNYIGTLTAL